MDRQIRLHYDGSWTRWFNDGDEQFLTLLSGLEISAVEISETMTRAEFQQKFPDHPISEQTT